MKILFLCLYPENTAPSQRFRFEQFFPYFKEAGIEFEVDSFYSYKVYKLLYQKGNRVRKAFLILSAYLRRLFKLDRFRKYDYIFIQRAAAPIGPAFFETILARWMKKRIIYDFDDSIWMPQDGKGGVFFRWIKNHDKVGAICRMAHYVTTGNDFLADYARKFTSKVLVVPTVVDTQTKYAALKEHHLDQRLTVGWTGSHSTLRYLMSLQETLMACDKDPDISFVIIADKLPEDLKLSKLQFILWKEETEIEDLLTMDVGIMPLVDNEWTRGKCGFKAIQYMAVGIPALVAPVGVNEKIVDNGINGFVCRNTQEWEEKIQLLKANPALRKQMGEAARVKMEQFYSVSYAFPLLLSVLGGKPSLSS